MQADDWKMVKVACPGREAMIDFQVRNVSVLLLRISSGKGFLKMTIKACGRQKPSSTPVTSPSRALNSRLAETSLSKPYSYLSNLGMYLMIYSSVIPPLRTPPALPANSSCPWGHWGNIGLISGSILPSSPPGSGSIGVHGVLVRVGVPFTLIMMQ